MHHDPVCCVPILPTALPKLHEACFAITTISDTFARLQHALQFSCWGRKCKKVEQNEMTLETFQMGSFAFSSVFLCCPCCSPLVELKGRLAEVSRKARHKQNVAAEEEVINTGQREVERWH